jgi:Family of unknown function (DUF6776)
MKPRYHAKQYLLFAISALLVGAVAYLSFELGRYEAGYSKFDERRHIGDLTKTIAARDAEIEELNRNLAILETSHDIDAETYETIRANFTQLQEKIQAQEEELGFYRGIVSPGDGVAGLRIQDVEVVSDDPEHQHHLLRLTLVQAIVHNQRVTGTVRVKFSGSLDNEVAEFDLGELVADEDTGEIAYGFRYFQSLERDLVLPAGFEPEQIEIEIWPREPRGDPQTQTFSWAAVQG